MQAENRFTLFGKIVLEDRVIVPGIVEVFNGVITKVSGGEFQQDYIDLRHRWICPGFIDTHIHAADGSDFMDNTPESFKAIRHALPKYGVTSFLATSRVSSYEKIDRFLSISSNEQGVSDDGAELIGVHLEGPWINPLFAGAQNQSFIKKPDLKALEEWTRKYPGLLKIVTLAPELSGSLEIIGFLNNIGIIASAGHTNAALEEMKIAVKAGLRNVTHCFNAMSPVHHRNPGAAFAALYLEELTCELIADGLHVHPDVIRFLYKIKMADKINLISDCTGANNLSDGAYVIGGKGIMKDGKKITLENGTLAGSAITLEKAVQFLIKECEVPIHDAVRMASANQAQSMALPKGRLKKGYEADIAILNENFEVEWTMVHGKTVFKKGGINPENSST